jgi:hypothetical protein
VSEVHPATQGLVIIIPTGDSACMRVSYKYSNPAMGCVYIQTNASDPVRQLQGVFVKHNATTVWFPVMPTS